MNQKTYYLITCSLLFIIVLAIVIVLNVRATDSFTELFFEDPNNLPNTVKIGQKYGFVFNVYNLENNEKRYQYLVTFNYNNKEQELDRGSFVLKHNESMMIQNVISIEEKFKDGMVKVILLDEDQEIHFFVKQEG
ncbi:MAG TPA: DUF1616 domain-containing protein [Candidatus Nanoarchaeia archaeon]|nr:DUF1616 domain-containing protein [Candidatus Nanoarchaeia archaeon]